MGEREGGRFASTWDALESVVHVGLDDQVTTQEASVPELVSGPVELDRRKASGMAGGFPVS